MANVEMLDIDAAGSRRFSEQGFLTVERLIDPAAVARLMSECESALKAHVAAYPLALATSARSGEGIAELRAHLGALAGAAAIH